MGEKYWKPGSEARCVKCGQAMNGPKLVQRGPLPALDTALEFRCPCGWRSYSPTLDQQERIEAGELDAGLLLANRRGA